MLGYVAHKEGGSFEFRHMFEGFKALYFKRLVMLGVFYTILIFAVVILVGIFAFVMFGGFEFFQEIEQAIDQAQVEVFYAYATAHILILLISIILFTPCTIAMWFAPIIIISSKKTALSAMLLSFTACLKNILPFILYYIGIYSFYTTHARFFGADPSSQR